MRLKKEEHPKIVISAPQPETQAKRRDASKSPSPNKNAVLKHKCDSEDEEEDLQEEIPEEN